MKEKFLEKVKDCHTAEQVKELAEREGVQLTDEMLQGVAGGFGPEHLTKKCTYCKFYNGNTGERTCQSKELAETGDSYDCTSFVSNSFSSGK